MVHFNYVYIQLELAFLCVLISPAVAMTSGKNRLLVLINVSAAEFKLKRLFEQFGVR